LIARISKFVAALLIMLSFLHNFTHNIQVFYIIILT